MRKDNEKTVQRNYEQERNDPKAKSKNQSKTKAREQGIKETKKHRLYTALLLYSTPPLYFTSSSPTHSQPLRPTPNPLPTQTRLQLLPSHLQPLLQVRSPLQPFQPQPILQPQSQPNYPSSSRRSVGVGAGGVRRRERRTRRSRRNLSLAPSPAPPTTAASTHPRSCSHSNLRLSLVPQNLNSRRPIRNPTPRLRGSLTRSRVQQLEEQRVGPRKFLRRRSRTGGEEGCFEGGWRDRAGFEGGG